MAKQKTNKKSAYKMVKRTSNSVDYEALVQMVHELLAKLNSNKIWAKEDDAKLKRVKDLAAVITKIKPLEKHNPPSEEYDISDDEEIMRRFVERYNARMAASTKD